MPTTAILSPATGDVVSQTVNVFVSFDVTGYALGDYDLKCDINGQGEQSSPISSPETSGTRTFTFNLAFIARHAGKQERNNGSAIYDNLSHRYRIFTF